MRAALYDIALLAQAEGGGGGEEEGGSFLVSPNVGLMIWTLLAFGLTLFILRRLAFPRIAEALEKRRRAIEESIESAERTRAEADELLAEYRQRLKEAREQAEDIVARARKAGDTFQEESKAQAKRQHDELMESTRREIEAETRRALAEIRKEVANLTVVATEKVARKSLDDDDHKRLIEEALAEVDFSALTGEQSNGGESREGRG
jgi:F-type H+-transporting ATPase subunit b